MGPKGCFIALFFAIVAFSLWMYPPRLQSGRPGDLKGDAVLSQKKITHTKEEWKSLLTPEQYRVTREGGTEPPFSGKYYNHREKGTYLCSNCGNGLFRSDSKFDSEVDGRALRAPVARKRFDPGGPVPRHDQGGSALRQVRRAPRPPVPRWASPDGSSLLHKLRSPGLQPRQILSPRYELRPS